MKSRRIAILLPAATLFLSVAPLTQAASASQVRAHAPAVSRSDSSRDVNEKAGNPDKSRSDNGRPDTSTSSSDTTGTGHDAGDR